LQLGLDLARLFNPHLRHARSDERGYVSIDLTDDRAEARLIGVQRPNDPDSPCQVQARFEVLAGHPGARPMDLPTR
jgi:alkaline phosphatase D